MTRLTDAQLAALLRYYLHVAATDNLDAALIVGRVAMALRARRWFNVLRWR